MTITDFLRYVTPGIPGVPTALAKQAVLDAANEFFSESKCWRELQDPLTLTDGENQFDLEPPAGAMVIEVRDILCNWRSSGRLEPVSLDTLRREMPDWLTATSNLPSRYTRALDFTTFSVFPIPDAPPADAEMRVLAVYTLRESATTLPDDIVRRWREPLAAGAKSRLLITSKDNPWRDLELGNYYAKQFRSGLEEALIDASNDHTAGPVIVPPVRFG